MAKKPVTKKEISIIINGWSKEDARDFLLKGGLVKTKVENFDKEGNLTSYCITEKQIPPNYKMHLVPKEAEKINNFKKLKNGMK